MPQISVAGHSLEYQWVAGGRTGAASPTLVFLHEGLGSIRRWGGFPARVAQATGCGVLVYDRYGYGKSDVLAEDRVGIDFMHREALTVLPEVLLRLRVVNPVLVGHSDGASIAIIYAGAGHPVRGLVLMAPHVFTEPGGLASIREAKRQFETTDFPERMRKYHRDPHKTFYLWSDVWLDPSFERWNIEASISQISCPVLLIQGEDDEYGTMAQLDAIARQVGGRCEQLRLPQCGHSPSKDQPEQVLDGMVTFIREL
jgi:pimeloyl-ACP methyl ester carboxylesterase